MDNDKLLKLIGKLKFIRDYECKVDGEVFAMNEAIIVLSNLPPAQQWIPVTERLPDQQETVLIQDFDDITIGYLNGENRWRDLTNLDDYLKDVIAWQPLPEPYREESNE